MEPTLKEGERVDYLIHRDLKIIQHQDKFCFSLDAVLLAWFANVRPHDRVIDLGTGTGVIPLLLVARQPQVTVEGWEIQTDMVDLARRSVELNSLEKQIHITAGDLREAYQHYGCERFTLVTCNPPYQQTGTGDQNFDLSRALARHELNCTLEEVIQAAARLVTYRGRLTLVHRPQRLTEIIVYLRQHGLEPKRMRLVQPRPKSRPKLILIEAIKGAQPGLHLEPTLVIYQTGSEYTEEMQKILYGI